MMPTSFIDLESGKRLCCCPGGYCCFPPFIPSAGQGMLGRGCASSRGRARLEVPGTGVGLACPSLPLGNTRWDRWPWLPVQRLCAEQTGEELI